MGPAMLHATRTWALAGTAGVATLLLATLAFAGAPAVLDGADAPLLDLGGAAVPLALAKLLGFLGNAEVLVPVILVLALGLLYRERAADAALVLGAFLVEEVLVEAIKSYVARPRPDDGWILASGWSFPSGHAARAALLACLLVYLHRHRLMVAFAVAWAFLGGAARVVLGVHHTTDVAAGLGLGLAIGAFGAMMAALWTERRQTVRVPVTVEEPTKAPTAPRLTR